MIKWFYLFVLMLGETMHATPLSIEEKVGQIMMVHFQGEEANEDAQILINKCFVGGIIYYKSVNGLHSPEHVQKLSSQLQKLAQLNKAKIPLIISVDQEGGRVNRLTTGFTLFPSNEEVARTLNPKIAENNAYITGKELKAVGINMNLAPVVDVVLNRETSVIGNRSFGDPSTVVEFAKAALNGYDKSGIISTLKHFPGYGDVSIDPHLALPCISKSYEELSQIELYPFQQLHPYAQAIMSAHIFMPALDPNNCATLSSTILRDLLRENWGYKGIVISDSLTMQGILDQCSGNISEAAIRAFLAGNDILIFGTKFLTQKDKSELTCADLQKIHADLTSAVKSGRISENLLDESVERILSLKRKLD